MAKTELYIDAPLDTRIDSLDFGENLLTMTDSGFGVQVYLTRPADGEFDVEPDVVKKAYVIRRAYADEKNPDLFDTDCDHWSELQFYEGTIREVLPQILNDLKEEFTLATNLPEGSMIEVTPLLWDNKKKDFLPIPKDEWKKIKNGDTGNSFEEQFKLAAAGWQEELIGKGLNRTEVNKKMLEALRNINAKHKDFTH